jgi:hypothetical protein
MGKANGNTTTLLPSLDSLFPKTEINMRDASSGDKKNPEVNYSPFGSPGGGSVSRGNIQQQVPLLQEGLQRKGE